MTRIKGVLAVMISALVFGSMPLMAKTIYQEGGNAITITFLRFVLVIPVLYFFVSRNKNLTVRVTKNELLKLILVGTLGYGGTALTLYMSYNYIASGIATTLHFLYPVIVIFTYMLLFKYPPTKAKISAISLTLLGIILLNNSSGDINLFGLSLAFLSAITYSFYIIFLDRSGLKYMNPLKMTMYLCIIGSTMMLIFGLVTQSLSFDMSALGWAVAFILAITVAFLGVSLFQVGIVLIGPESTSILSTLEPITSIIIGVLIFNEIITMKMVLGFTFILLAVLIVTVFEK